MKKTDHAHYSLMPEKQLADLARIGQDAAFDEVVNRYKLQLYLVAVAMLSSSAKAEKSVSVTLAKARKNLHEYHGESLLLTWLYRQLQKYILTHYKLSGSQALNQKNSPPRQDHTTESAYPETE